MKISVVIPTYKAAAFIDATLASVFAQTVPPEELIVVDDGSPDDTVVVVTQAFVDAPFPCRLIRLDTNSGGPAKPMNAGIDAAIGEWIVTLDHDDELLPNRIERLKPELANAGDCGAIIARMIVREQNDDRGHLLDASWTNVEKLMQSSKRAAHEVSGGASPAYFVRGSSEIQNLSIVDSATAYTGLAEFGCYAMSCSAMAFPKRVWQEIGGFDETVKACIDFAFLEAALRSHPLGVLDFPAAFWRHLPSNLSHDFRQRVYDVTVVMQRIHDRYQSLPPRLTTKLRNDLLDRAYLLMCRRERTAAWRAWRQCLRQYGLRPRSLVIATKMLVKSL